MAARTAWSTSWPSAERISRRSTAAALAVRGFLFWTWNTADSRAISSCNRTISALWSASALWMASLATVTVGSAVASLPVSVVVATPPPMAGKKWVPGPRRRSAGTLGQGLTVVDCSPLPKQIKRRLGGEHRARGASSFASAAPCCGGASTAELACKPNAT